jgi:hypothetical protein
MRSRGHSLQVVVKRQRARSWCSLGVEAGGRAAGRGARLVVELQEAETGAQNNGDSDSDSDSDPVDDVRKESLVNSVFENVEGISWDSFSDPDEGGEWERWL